MRIYVACRFSQYERARRLMDALTDAGHTITHDWTRTPEFDADGHPIGSDSDLSPSVQAGHALDDQRGALIELGMAMAYGVPVVVVAPWRDTIFWNHPGVGVHATVQDALRPYVDVDDRFGSDELALLHQITGGDFR